MDCTTQLGIRVGTETVLAKLDACYLPLRQKATLMSETLKTDSTTLQCSDGKEKVWDLRKVLEDLLRNLIRHA